MHGSFRDSLQISKTLKFSLQIGAIYRIRGSWGEFETTTFYENTLVQACPDLVTLRANIKKFNEYSI
jgi:hypothetical protein